jgi:hypothetical protein
MAYYAREDFFNDPELIARSVEVLKGNLKLDWMALDVEKVRCHPSHPERGLTYDDVNVGSYGWDRIPERIRHNFSMAPRGSVMPPGLPSLGYDINRKSEVWSDECARLYEESKSRHWNSALDVPWAELERAGSGEDAERALAQLYTDLCTMATVLGDIPSKWVWRINHELLELKSWLCAQMFDAARLADAFRKRAIAGGAGLGRDHAGVEELCKGVLDSGTFPCASVCANLALAGLMQAVLRQIGASAQSAADQTLVALALQDVSRFLAYGTSHVRGLLEARPHERIALAGHLDGFENLVIGWLGSPLVYSALAVLRAGGREGAAAAAPDVARLYGAFASEHAARRERAGLLCEGPGPLARFADDLAR